MNMYDYSARWKDDFRFTTVDPMAEKYYSISPYAYVKNNPINAIDPNGDTIQVVIDGVNYNYGQDKNGNYGFIGTNGALYSGNNIFVNKLTSALSTLRGTSDGLIVINELQGSTNLFTIESNSRIEGGGNKFKASDNMKAYANQLKTDPNQAATLQALNNAGIDISGGSGGIIYWDPLGGTVQTTSGADTNTTTNLLHEMGHGYDANRGLLDDRIVDGQPRHEWQASFRENMVRSQLSNVPARTLYGKNLIPMLTPRVPLRPFWY